MENVRRGRSITRKTKVKRIESTDQGRVAIGPYKLQYIHAKLLRAKQALFNFDSNLEKLSKANDLTARRFGPSGCILPLPTLADRFRHLRQPFPIRGLFQHFLCGKVFHAVWRWIPQRLEKACSHEYRNVVRLAV